MSPRQSGTALVVIEQDPHDPALPLTIEGLQEADINQLHHAFVRDTIRLALAAGAHHVRLFVADPKQWTDVTASAGESTLISSCPKGGWGKRVSAALALPFDPGIKEVIILGTRTPTLTPDLLQRAFRLTRQSEVAIGPTPDGDWYLIGLSHPLVFKDVNIDWDSHHAYAQLTDALNEQEVKWAELDLWYPIDSGDALEVAAREINQYRFEGDSETARDTEMIVERLIARL